MEYTEEQKEAFKRELAARRQRPQILFGVVIFPLGILAALALCSRMGLLDPPWIPRGIVGLLFIASMMAVLAYRRMTWKCPACNKSLGSDDDPKACLLCGIPLK